MRSGLPDSVHSLAPPRRDEDAVAVASGIRPPSPALQYIFRMSRPDVQLSQSISGHSSRTSIDSIGSINSQTPLTPAFNHADIEKHSFSSEDNLRDALEQDLAILQPVEEHYHRQRKWWLFSMVWAHQLWWLLTILGNLPFVLRVARLDRSPARTSWMAQVALGNMALAVLVRNELILCCFYWLASMFPFRRFYAHRMLHSVGGLHVGCALATFVWIILYVVQVGLEADLSSTLQIALLTTALILPIGITIIIFFALRPIRERYHNIWEYTHRYVGWFVVADLVAHLTLKSLTLASPIQLFRTSLPYLTLISVISIFYVWFTVRKPRISIRANRSVAVLTFPGSPTMRTGTFARISRDGREWHAFSVAMTDSQKNEFSLIVAKAGDWTSKLIHDTLDRQGPGRMWIRGVQAPGFMYMHRSYKKVVTICTGAGIAPALPHIQHATSDIFLIWIAKNHRKTYGETVWAAVTSNIPSHKLILHDTGEYGRPDIGTLIERAAGMHEAEAVFVVSNDPYTRLVSSICWRKGLRCYGATRDS